MKQNNMTKNEMNRKGKKLKKIESEILGFLLLLLFVFLFFTFAVDDFNFLRGQNLLNIATDAVIPAVFAAGMGIIVAAGGFDLSLGHIGSIAALVTAYLMNPSIGMYPVPAILVGLLVGASIGLFSGYVVTRWGISSFIVTLGVQFLIIGIRQIITGGRSVYVANPGFKSLAGKTAGVPHLLIVLLIIGIIVYIVMEKTALGRKMQFIGSNIEGSRFIGIDTKNITMLTFVLGGVLAAFGGMLFAARAGAVQINSVDAKLLDAITIAIFSSVLCKRFRMIGIVMVSLLIVMIGTGMSMMGIKTEWIDFVKGCILLASIFLSKVSLSIMFRKKRVEGVNEW